jgi:hypothetical protein
VIFVLALAVFVNVQQRVLRWRAERLLADIRAIQIGKSNVTDARRLMQKWGAWGEWQGDCEKDWCEFRVWLDDLSGALGRYPVLDSGQWAPGLRWPRWINRPYGWAGGRFVEVEAGFFVKHGVIWSKSFAVLVTPATEKLDTRGELMPISESSVMGRAQSSSDCFHEWRGAPRPVFHAANPEVCFDADDELWHWAIAQFTPFADENTIDQLMDFNLECLSRWKACRSAKELMPTAMSLLEESKKQVSRSGSQIEDLPLWILARDLQYVAVGEVLAIPGSRSANQHTAFRAFRIEKLLKGDHLISGAGIYMVDTAGSEEMCSALPTGKGILRSGTKMLLMFNEPLNRDLSKESEFATCIAAPANAENLSEVQRGIARDGILRDSAVY